MILIVERIENIIDQDNNREGRTKLKNVDQNIDEIAESPVFSSSSVIILEMSDLASVPLQVNEICDREEEVTASVSNEIEKQIIHREIFVIKNEKVNITIKNTVKHWEELKRKVRKGINNNSNSFD